MAGRTYDGPPGQIQGHRSRVQPEELGLASHTMTLGVHLQPNQ